MGREDGRVQTVYAGVYTCTRHYTAVHCLRHDLVYSRGRAAYAPAHMYTDGRVHGRVHRTRPVHGCVHGQCSWLCTKPCTGGVHGDIHGSVRAVQGLCTQLLHHRVWWCNAVYTACTGRVRVYTAVYMARSRPCRRPLHGRVRAVYTWTVYRCTRVHLWTRPCTGRVHAVYTVPCTRYGDTVVTGKAMYGQCKVNSN